jgi:hypothetical protein
LEEQLVHWKRAHSVFSANAAAKPVFSTKKESKAAQNKKQVEFLLDQAANREALYHAQQGVSKATNQLEKVKRLTSKESVDADKERLLYLESLLSRLLVAAFSDHRPALKAVLVDLHRTTNQDILRLKEAIKLTASLAARNQENSCTSLEKIEATLFAIARAKEQHADSSQYATYIAAFELSGISGVETIRALINDCDEDPADEACCVDPMFVCPEQCDKCMKEQKLRNDYDTGRKQKPCDCEQGNYCLVCTPITTREEVFDE